MKKLLYMNLYEDATSYYRIAPLQFLNNTEITVDRKPYQGNITWALFTGYDILFLERPSSHNDLAIIKLAKQCCLKVITDWDDDCIHVDGYNPMYHTYEQNKAVVLECIALSDEVWVSTGGIKRSFQLFNKNIHVIPNAHNDYLQPPIKRKSYNTETRKAIWRGGESHESDVYNVAEQILPLVNDNTDWQFQFIGCRFIYLEQRCGNNYTPVSQMPLMQYFQYIYDENPNIMFHPLCKTVFNKSKSNIAWMEASYAGAAFFGNKELPEFSVCPWTMDFDNIGIHIGYNLREYSDKSWAYIMENLLLSNVNKIREERILSI